MSRLCYLLALTPCAALRSGARAVRRGVAVHAEPTRRATLQSVAATALLLVAPPAFASDAAKFNKKLDSLGLPPLGEIPDGYNPLITAYSQEAPLLVQFLYPSNWLVVKPSSNTNGEAGTISAGDYGKGDSAAFFYSPVAPPAGGIATAPKSYFTSCMQDAMTQKGANQLQMFKVLKVTQAGSYAIVDFTYELLTGAGFVVERRGVGSVTSLGGASQILATVTTSARWKKLSEKLTTTAKSFRVYQTTKGAQMTPLIDDE